MPWSVLLDGLREGKRPSASGLWAFGCESIKYAELEALRAELSGIAHLVFEQLEADNSRFLDPLVYAFWTRRAESEESVLVLLVQFKTYPMGDDDHFELNALQRGNSVYVFGERGVGIRLSSIICSDAFAFRDEHATELFDRSLIIHIQLNPKPRQTQYRAYRDLLFKYGDGATELLCLNWAASVEEWDDLDKTKDWANVSASAWYLQPRKFDDRDQTVLENHRRGLYYTWFESLRSHALFFNYRAAVFELIASKVFHHGVTASMSRRRGPLVTQPYSWHDTENRWTPVVALEDGFVESLGPVFDPAIRDIGTREPVHAERVFALGSGSVSCEEWHRLAKVDSFAISQTEVVNRITACQDTDSTAEEFRSGRISRISRLAKILNDSVQLPPALASMGSGWRFEWSGASPHQNVTSITTGTRATAVYVGEDLPIRAVEAVKVRLSLYLHKSAPSADASNDAKQRLAVWYRDASGDICLFQKDRYVAYDRTNESEVDFSRGQG